MSSFLTDFRLALRSMDTLCLEPSRALSMASAETRTRRRGGRLNFPRRSRTLIFRSLICRGRRGGGGGGHCLAALHKEPLWEAVGSASTKGSAPLLQDQPHQGCAHPGSELGPPCSCGNCTMGSSQSHTGDQESEESLCGLQRQFWFPWARRTFALSGALQSKQQP